MVSLGAVGRTTAGLLDMALNGRRPVRLIEAPTGPRYMVQLPKPQCPLHGWRAYAVLAVEPNGDGPLRFTLYERTDATSQPPEVQCSTFLR